jgi:hypothetical protein
LLRREIGGWAWWFTPVVLATWEVEIGRIEIPGQLGQKFLETPFQPIKRWCASVNLDYLGSINRRIAIVQACLGIKQDPVSKVIKAKAEWAGGMVLESPSECEA